MLEFFVEGLLLELTLIENGILYLVILLDLDFYGKMQVELIKLYLNEVHHQ